jgi:hypothetical protein
MSLDRAKRAADDAYDHFLAMGGSADRAQVVADQVHDLHAEVAALVTLTDEVGAAIDEVDHASTPEENIDRLDVVLEKLATARVHTDAVIDTCDEVEREIHEHLRGSDRADDVADQVIAARDELDQARTGLGELTEAVTAQHEAYTGARDGEPTVGATTTSAQRTDSGGTAHDEQLLRRAAAVYEALGEEAPRVNIAQNDAKDASGGAHTLDRHGPALRLRRGDPGVRTVEGRIFGDPPWQRPENWSYKWLDDSTMNRTVNDHLRSNWDDVRRDLALDGEYEKSFDAGHVVGEGFYNEGMYGGGPRGAHYHRTSWCTLRLRLAPGSTDPRLFVLTAFPTAIPK